MGFSTPAIKSVISAVLTRTPWCVSDGYPRVRYKRPTSATDALGKHAVAIHVYGVLPTTHVASEVATVCRVQNSGTMVSSLFVELSTDDAYAVTQSLRQWCPTGSLTSSKHMYHVELAFASCPFE
jgi:hypothetical protein